MNNKNPPKLSEALKFLSPGNVNNMVKEIEKKFLTACENGDMETLKATLPLVYYKGDGIRLVINRGDLQMLDYILSIETKRDTNLLCNVWPICSTMDPHNPVIDILIKNRNKPSDGLINACHVGNIPLVDYLLESGADDYQWGLNYSVRGNCLELVKKFVTLAHSKGIRLNINQAAQWIPVANTNINPEILKYLEQLEPGCTTRGLSSIMSLLFGIKL